MATIVIPASSAAITIGEAAFNHYCETTFLVRPCTQAAAGNTVASNPTIWSKLFEKWAGVNADGEAVTFRSLLHSTTKIWAPDAIVAQLTGQHQDAKVFADLSRVHRAAPDAKTWAAVELWMWWLPPSSFSGGKDGRTVRTSRTTTVWTTMLAGFRAENAVSATLPGLPEELWLYIFGFLKHDQQPTFPKMYVNIAVVAEDQTEAHFWIKITTTMRQLCVAYCKRQGFVLEKMLFKFGENEVDMDGNSIDHGMTASDVIHVTARQVSA